MNVLIHLLWIVPGDVFVKKTPRTGAYSGEERFHRRVNRTSNLAMHCPISSCDIPVVCANDEGEEVVSIVGWPVILPRDLAVSLINAGYEEIVFGNAAERSEYWDHTLKEYPMDISKRTVPLALYGDEATIWRQSVMCLHWQGILSHVSSHSLISRFLLAIIPSECYWVVSWLIRVTFIVGI